MNTDRAPQCINRNASHFSNELRKASSVCITKYDQICASILGGADGRQRVSRILSIAVEKMFRVVQYLAPLRFKMCNRIADHREVFLQSDLEYLDNMEWPSFADDCDRGRIRI